MKIVTINGQNHKGSTYHIGRMLAEKITSPDEITEIFLPREGIAKTYKYGVGVRAVSWE